MPILSTPLRSTISSPKAASRIGVAIAIVDARNDSSIADLDRRATGSSARAGAPEKPSAEAACRSRVECDQNDDHQALNDINQDRRDRVRRCIACEPLSSAPNRIAAGTIASGLSRATSATAIAS